ncbi:amidohydrolase family protein [Alcanivorax sp.]|uniref:amidohydrolase family protein n=1 Tax=Alcanivorax sp. TaxID=1872427 RepID=UPI0032D94955
MQNNDNDKIDTARRTVLKGALQFGALTAGGLAVAGCGGSNGARTESNTPSTTTGQDNAVGGGNHNNDDIPDPTTPDAPTLPTGNFRIDVHCHHIPDFYRASLAKHGIVTAGGIPIPAWSPSMAVDFMDKYGIQTQIVSISEPGVAYLSTPQERLDMAMEVNNYTTNELIYSNHYPGRFGGFAVLPIGDPNNPLDIINACSEATRAIKILGMDGIGLLSNYNGIYLGDPRFTPLMLTLNTLGCMVFVHPVTPVKPDSIILPTFLFEFTFDTTRAAVNMLYNGIYRIYPRIRWLLAHAGGTIPYLSYRTSLLTVTPALADSLGLEVLDEVKILASYGDLFYDTALSPAPAAMKSVREVTSLDHILFATDWPFAGPAFAVTTSGDPQPRLSETFTDQERLSVERENALKQFPSLSRRLEDA